MIVDNVRCKEQSSFRFCFPVRRTLRTHMTTSTDEVARLRRVVTRSVPSYIARTGSTHTWQQEIKRLERTRGFGFIRPDGESDDVFFHTSALQGLVFDSLNEGQKVEFEKQPDERDPRRSRAVNVRVAVAA